MQLATVELRLKLNSRNFPPSIPISNFSCGKT